LDTYKLDRFATPNRDVPRALAGFHDVLEQPSEFHGPIKIDILRFVKSTRSLGFLHTKKETFIDKSPAYLDVGSH